MLVKLFHQVRGHNIFPKKYKTTTAATATTNKTKPKKIEMVNSLFLCRLDIYR